jgi:hypothetical protein
MVHSCGLGLGLGKIGLFPGEPSSFIADGADKFLALLWTGQPVKGLGQGF